MPDLFYLVSKWWKQILLVEVLALAIVTVVLYTRPTRYLSVATAIPASSYAADKASVFNSGIQLLYPPVGTPDDLDMIVGTAQLDTVYIAVAEQFSLPDHYKVEEKERAAILKSAFLLKLNTRVIKSDFSELKVKVWDTDRDLAPLLANAILEKLQSIHQDLQNSNNIASLKSLQTGRQKIQAQIDSIDNSADQKSIAPQNALRKLALSEQLQQYEKLVGQYQLMVDSKPPVLIVVEKARAASWPDKPKKLPLLAGTFVLTFLFSLVLALVLEKRKTY
jgi:uncharacterized protein involved in exopolysaccharide biosynthesis